MESGVRKPDSGFIIGLCYPSTCSIMSEKAPFHWGRFPAYSISSISFLSFFFSLYSFLFSFLSHPLLCFSLHSFILVIHYSKETNEFIYLFIFYLLSIETYENGRWLLRFDDVMVLQLKLWRANYKQFFLRNIFQRLRRDWQKGLSVLENEAYSKTVSHLPGHPVHHRRSLCQRTRSLP